MSSKFNQFIETVLPVLYRIAAGIFDRNEGDFSRSVAEVYDMEDLRPEIEQARKARDERLKRK